jgi:hypothetical protein
MWALTLSYNIVLQKKPVCIGKLMLLSAKRVISFFFIALAVLLVLQPVDGFAQSRLKKCPSYYNSSGFNYTCFGRLTDYNGVKYEGYF